ncbi:MAG TPA: cytochrome b/b6 domain-containing protein [Xanthobacteraceae bacterium]
MTIEAATRSSPVPETAAGPLIHPRWVRVTHWVNAIAMLIMIGSGWQIYDASPLLGFLEFPSQIALGNWLAGALLWHFAAMWLLLINGIMYVALGILTGRFRRKLFPIRARDVVGDVGAALRGKLSHDDLARYNAAQKLLYLGVLIAGVVIVLSGLSIWKPVQFKWLTALFGGYGAARYVHFLAMTSIVAFLVVHVALAFIVPKSLRAMIFGR